MHVCRGAFFAGWAAVYCLLLVLHSALASGLETVPGQHLPCPLSLVGWATLGWPPITQSLLMNLWLSPASGCCGCCFNELPVYRLFGVLQILQISICRDCSILYDPRNG